ncbi:MAG: FAD-binding oxidoreductase [Chloroflexi bacterium]|nr:MAG: FAD-binding oxidoreductase [Chloroflexota bacterium]
MKAVAEAIDWPALQSTFQGSIALPGSEEYERARKPFIARFDELKPAAVALCAGEGDVVTALAFARRNEVEFAIRSGGHCFAGFSSSAGLVIDLSLMSRIRIADGQVCVGAGARIGRVHEALAAEGLALPSGSCPSVGVGGTTLGGGLGVLGRLHGLTLDHLLSVRIVLADGHLLEVDETREPDLFWALRGAGGGNFGVVTEFRFEPRPAPEMTNFYLVWPYRAATAVFDAWQRAAPNWPDQIAAGLAFTSAPGPQEEPLVEVFGAMVGTESDATALLGQIAGAAGADPEPSFCKQLSYRETCLYQAGLLDVANDQVEETPAGRLARQGCRFTKSEFFSSPLPIESVEALVRAFTADRAPGQFRGLELAPWGGAYNRVSPTATAFAHRGEAFSLKHAVIVDPTARPEPKEAAHAWARKSWASVHGHGSGRVYPNFPDPDLTDWEHAYYAENYPRLQRVKARYDPDGVFRFPHSIRLAG